MSQERSIDLFLGLETGKSDQLDCAIDHEGDKVSDTLLPQLESDQ